jgi:hypothetical protein
MMTAIVGGSIASFFVGDWGGSSAARARYADVHGKPSPPTRFTLAMHIGNINGDRDGIANLFVSSRRYEAH